MAVDNLAYFLASATGYGEQLWQSDGTSYGTGMLTGAAAGGGLAQLIQPSDLTAVGSTLYFTGLGSGNDQQLWETGPSQPFGAMVKDFSAPIGGDLTAFNGTLLFRGPTGLWASNTAGTAEIMATDSLRFGSPLVVAGSEAYFAADDHVNGMQLWKTDGTNAVMVTRYNTSGFSGFDVQQLVAGGKKVVFRGDDGSGGGLQLWASDGSASGTVKLTNGARALALQHAAAVGSELFFTVDYPTAQLWTSDGTASGTKLVTDFGSQFVVGTNFSGATGTLFFDANDETHGDQLWTSDGTPVGAKMVTSINADGPNPVGLRPGNFAAVGNTLFFSGDDGILGAQLWKYDGVTAQWVTATEVPGRVDSGSNPAYLTDVSGELFFAANDGSGVQLWRSDGTFQGTVRATYPTAYSGSLLVNASPGGNAYPVNEVNVGLKTFFFTTSDAQFQNESSASLSPANLWVTDGTPGGTENLASSLSLVPPQQNPASTVHEFNVNGKLLFFANPYGATGLAAFPQLWASDGTALGTHALANIQGAGPGQNVGPALVLGNELYFLLYNAFTSATLWESDGTAAGTRPVMDPKGGALSVTNNDLNAVDAGDLMNIGDTLYVVTPDNRLMSAVGGVSASLVYDFGSSLVGPPIATSNGKMIVLGVTEKTPTDTAQPESFWFSNGTPSGTVQIVSSEDAGGVPKLADVGSLAVFTVLYPDGTELLYDGSTFVQAIVGRGAKGTMQVSPLLNSGNWLFTEPLTTQTELWSTNSTETTYLKGFPGQVIDFAPELPGNSGKLIFGVAPAGGVGTLWEIDGTTMTQIGPFGSFSDAIGFAGCTYSPSQNVLIYYGPSTTQGLEVWRTDGTDTGTAIFQGLYSPAPTPIQNNYGPVSFFIPTSGESGATGFSSTDGSLSGVLPVTFASAVEPITGYAPFVMNPPYGQNVLIAARDGMGSIQPWILSPVTKPIEATGATLSATAGISFANQAVARFTDPNGDDPLNLYSADIKWGDGASSTGAITGANGSFTVTGSHSYTEANQSPFSVNVAIHRAGSPDGHATATANVTSGSTNPPDFSATAAGALSPATAGANSTFTLATFTGPAQGGFTLYTSAIDWGDGLSSDGTISPPDANGVYMVAGSHTYAEPSATPHTVTVTIAENILVPPYPIAKAITVTDSATVAEAPLSGKPVDAKGATFTAAAGVSFANQTVATFTDPNGAGPLSDYSASIDWGDKTSATTGTITGPDANGRFTVTGSHTYSQASTSPETLTVTLHRAGAADVTATDAVTVAASAQSGPLNANEDVYVIGTGTVSVAAANGLLANDTGAGTLSVVAGTVTGAEGGTFTFNADGSFTYAPPTNFPGFDDAKYTARDALGDQSTATVNVLSQTGGVVWKFYEQVLHRDPDYAGLQGWINDFANGGKPGDIAAGFFESTELLDQLIAGFYQQYLSRAAQANDLDFWGRRWRENGGPETIRAQFASSVEFNNLAEKQYGAYPDGWVTALYERILNRAPQGDDLPFWEKQLASGTTEGQVTLFFFTSSEADGGNVTGWFEEYLGRAPSSAELTQYVNQMLGGAKDRDIEQAIANLPEYLTNPPASPAGAGVRLPDYLPETTGGRTQAAVAATDAVFAKLA